MANETVEQRYSRIYVGCKFAGREVFRSLTTPTPKTHGKQYAAVIGPFHTVRGAAWMAHPTRGRDNPHCRTVADAERLAKKYKSEYDEKAQKWPEPDALAPLSQAG
jgi:hypothetical protein